MMHTTLGLDIGTRAIRYVLCQVDGQKISIKESGSFPFKTESSNSAENNGEISLRKTDETDPLAEAFKAISDKIAEQSHLPIDAIGMTVDPTQELSTHRILPFNDPRMVNQILDQQLNDIWTIDENSQISFQILDFVKGTANSEDEAVTSDGYDVYVIHYPKSGLVPYIERTKNTRIEPHVILPANEALPFAFNTLLDTDIPPYILLDIGEINSTLYVIDAGKVRLSRSFKIGSANIDEILAEALEISTEEARQLKETSGFVCDPGQEIATYERLLTRRKISPFSGDLSTMTKSCTRAMNLLVSAMRQTLIQFVTKTQLEPQVLYLTGNGAKLGGLEQWFSENLKIKCSQDLPYPIWFRENIDNTTLDAIAAALSAAWNIDSKVPLNLRHGTLAHKGSLAFIQDNKWLIAALVVAILAALVFMTVTKTKMIQQEHDKLRAALEQTTQDVFGKKLLTYDQIENEVNQSQGFTFIPEKTAFTHFMWISNQVNDNLSDVEMDFNSLDIDTQRKIVTIRGEVTGDEGLPKFMQLMEQYECFPNEIQEPKTSKVKDKVTFTLRIDANHCATGDDSE